MLEYARAYKVIYKENHNVSSCDSSAVWFHEDCVELTADNDSFVCPDCDSEVSVMLCALLFSW